LVLDTGSQVLGNLSYQGSYDTDGVYIYGTVNGSASIVNGANNKHAAAEDDLFIGDYAGPGGHVPESGSVLGGLSYTGSTGPDHLRIAAGSVLKGGATFDMDGGNNKYDLDQAWTETGLLTFKAGTGNDNLGTLGGTVNGDESFSLGDGNNTVRLAGTFNGATTTYNGGNGVDSVTLAGSYKAFKGFFLGANDVFRYEAGSKLTSFYGDFGAGTDTYDKSAVVVTWPETLIGLP